MHSPADASPTPSREPAHGSGPMRFATPSSWRTFTTYSLPVSPAHTKQQPCYCSTPSNGPALGLVAEWRCVQSTDIGQPAERDPLFPGLLRLRPEGFCLLSECPICEVVRWHLERYATD